MEKQRHKLQRFVFVLLFTAACLLQGNLWQVQAQEASVNLAYGDESLADEDAFVITILGEGYTSSEIEKFEERIKEIPEAFLSCSPWNELAPIVKIYSVCVPSKESGCRGDHADSYEEMLADSRDTRYEAQYWYNGIDRLLVINRYDRQYEDIRSYKPETDFTVILVNSEKYGGSGGAVSVTADDYTLVETMLHEAGHTVAMLKDEYQYIPYECANVTQEADPEKVSWKDFVGKNGVGVYSYGDNMPGWYVPAKNCKMRELYVDFCEVCKEEIRKQVCGAANATVLYYQPYARENASIDGRIDLCGNLILRKGSEMLTGDAVEDKLKITYYDGSGSVQIKAPSEAGSYIARVSFTGMEGWPACEQTFSFELDHSYQMKWATANTYCAACTECDKIITKKLAVPEISGLKALKRKLSFVAEIDDPFADGIQIRYYAAKNAKNTLKTKVVKGHGNKKVVLYGLTSGKSYVVKVRAYHQSGDKTTYSPWMTLDTIKVK